MSDPTNPTIIYEGVPDDGSPALSFSGRGAHHAAAAAVRHTGGKVWRLSPVAVATDAGIIYRTARSMVMVVTKIPPVPPEDPSPLVDL